MQKLCLKTKDNTFFL